MNYLSLILATIALILFTACGGGSGNDSNPTTKYENVSSVILNEASNLNGLIISAQTQGDDNTTAELSFSEDGSFTYVDPINGSIVGAWTYDVNLMQITYTIKKPIPTTAYTQLSDNIINLNELISIIVPGLITLEGTVSFLQVPTPL